MNFDKMTDDDILLEDDTDVLSENDNDILVEYDNDILTEYDNDILTEDDNDILAEYDNDILIENDKDILLEDDGDKPYTISDAYTAGDAELDLEDEEDYSPASRIPKQGVSRNNLQNSSKSKYEYSGNFSNNSSSDEYIEDEADEAFAKSEKKSKTGSVIRTIILVAALAVFCFSAYQLINIFSEYRHDAEIYKGIDMEVVEKDASVTVELPDGKVVIPFKYDHDALLAINSEGLGYIYVPGINKRLPIAQTTDNTYYIRHAFDHSFSMAGSIFVDYRVPDKLNSPNVVIHGHNRQDGTMFAYLENYLKESYYRKDGYDIFYIYTENKIMKYRIFSVYITEPVSDAYTFNFDSVEELREFAARMKDKSKYDTGVDISQTTQIATLSTCTDDTTQRIIVHGTFIGEAPIE